MFSRNSIYPLPHYYSNPPGPIVGLFPYISVATITTFPGTSLMLTNVDGNWVE